MKEVSLQEPSVRNKYPDFEVADKHYTRQKFKDLRDTHALIHCRLDYLQACWSWLFHE